MATRAAVTAAVAGGRKASCAEAVGVGVIAVAVTVSAVVSRGSNKNDSRSSEGHNQISLNQQAAQPSTKFRGSIFWQALGNKKHHPRRLASLFQKEKQKLATEFNITKVWIAEHATPRNSSKRLCDSESLTVALNCFRDGWT